VPAFEEVRSLPGGGKVNDLAFNGDGTRMATVSDAGTITIWDTGSWQEVLILPTQDRLTGVAFSPDGASITTVSGSGEVRMYAMDLARLLAIADQRVSRPLTDEECRRYLHAPCDPDGSGTDQPAPSNVGQPTALDGSYHVTVESGSYTLTLLDGIYRLTENLWWRSWGTYEVTDDRLVLTEVSDARCAGVRYEGTWIREGAALTLNDLEVVDTKACPEESSAAVAFASEPWTRLGELAA
jgi:hypothetical protein